MLNIVYACDEKYNLQLQNSIYSILSNTNHLISIFIIHKNPETFKNYKTFLINTFKNLKIEIYKFDNTNFSFPNLINKHVSEATYYRLFVDRFIPKNIDFFVYLDADILAINDIGNYYLDVQKKILDSNQSIGCRTEFIRNEINSEKFFSLKMNANNYFNAGVMFIDYKKWQNEKHGKNLLINLTNNNLDFEYWDQDLLNSYFDGDYFEISECFNKNINLRWKHSTTEIQFENILLHFQGNNKPWNIRTSTNKISNLYHDVSFKTIGKYHLEIKIVRRDLIYLFFNTINLSALLLNKKTLYFKNVIQEIFKKIKVKL